MLTREFIECREEIYNRPVDCVSLAMVQPYQKENQVGRAPPQCCSPPMCFSRRCPCGRLKTQVWLRSTFLNVLGQAPIFPSQHAHLFSHLLADPSLRRVRPHQTFSCFPEASFLLDRTHSLTLSPLPGCLPRPRLVSL